MEAVGTVLVVLEVLIGLFWLGVGGFQLCASVFLGGLAVLTFVGIWNLVWGAASLGVISSIYRRRPGVARSILVQAVLGAVWGLFAGLWLGAWLQFLVLPLYIALGVVAATNSASIGPRTSSQPAPGFSPAPVVAPPQPSFCPACGTSLMTGAAFCQACGARVAPVATQ
jgi:hypothetical protein